MCWRNLFKLILIAVSISSDVWVVGRLPTLKTSQNRNIRKKKKQVKVNDIPLHYTPLQLFYFFPFHFEFEFKVNFYSTDIPHLTVYRFYFNYNVSPHSTFLYIYLFFITFLFLSHIHTSCHFIYI